MKASLLVKVLAEYISEYGDQEVVFNFPEDGIDIDYVSADYSTGPNAALRFFNLS